MSTETTYKFPPGSSLPSSAQLALYVADPLGSLRRWTRRYGDTFTVNFLGVGQFVFTSSPEYNRSIFTADPTVLEAGPQNAGLLPIVGRESLLTLDGPAHARHRKLILPLFHGDRLRRAVEVIHTTAMNSITEWPIGRTFRLQPFLTKLTLDVVMRIVFGAYVDRARLTRLFSQLFEALSSPLFPLLTYWRIDPIKFAPWLPSARLKKEIDRILFEEIAHRRGIQEKHGTNSDDAFSLLIAACDENGQPLSEVELRDELVSLVIASHETVAGALGWAIDLLLANPPVLDRVLQELNRIMGTSFDSARLDELAYLDAVLKESLRLRPVLAVVARRAQQSFAEHARPGNNLIILIESSERESNLRFAEVLRAKLESLKPNTFAEIEWGPDRTLSEWMQRWRWLYADLESIKRADELLDLAYQERLAVVGIARR